MKAFLQFMHEEIAVDVDDIVLIRTLHEGDTDPRTGRLPTHIPDGARTRVDTRSAGFFYVTEDFHSIFERLTELNALLGEAA